MLSRWIAGVHTYSIPLVDVGIVGLFALKGFVLLTAVLLFPLCHSMSSPYAQHVPFVFSAIVVSVGLYIVVYLPMTVSIYGPPGTGKTLTTRRLCWEFAARTEAFGSEYVNLKECRTLFSAANELLAALTGEQKKAYEGLDRVFAAIWDALEDYLEWTVLILNEIDHIQYDSHSDSNDFFYRRSRPSASGRDPEAVHSRLGATPHRLRANHVTGS